MNFPWNRRQVLLGSTAVFAALLLIMFLVLLGLRAYIEPQLPSADAMRNLQIFLRQRPPKAFDRYAEPSATNAPATSSGTAR